MTASVQEAAAQRRAWNGCRFDAGAATGHYESWFQRANHPTRPLAFWIRYTIFRPLGRPADAVGELWAIVFDGEKDRVTSVKEVVPLTACSFSASALDVQIGAAVLDDTHLEGRASLRGHAVEWTLDYDSPQPPLLLLPPALYASAFPKAKALVGSPGAVFHGGLLVDGEALEIDGWTGSQNHNWGSRHTDSYAWGQVAGFDNEPDAFLECSTAQLKLGPLWTPRMSLVVLRVAQDEYALNSLAQALRSRGAFGDFHWTIAAPSAAATLSVRFHAPRSAFVGLAYDNPPGGTKTCLNTKLATCEVTLERPGKKVRTFTTRHRAAFEMLTDRSDHGVAVVA